MSLHVVILAAGQGKRMYSLTPKVLHSLAGKPMLQRVVETAEALHPEAIHVIYGHGGEIIRKALPNLAVNWVEQSQQLGTGHALLQALPHIPATAKVLVLYADVPLIQAQTLSALLEQTPRGLGLLLAKVADPAGLGRILRNEQEAIIAIIEEKDASPEQRKIGEIYSGICCAQAQDLAGWLPALKNQNKQGEYYLTDIIKLAVKENLPIFSLIASDNAEIQGVNNRLQLQELERCWQQNLAKTLMLQGVMLADASRLDVRGNLHCERDVFIDINCVFTGDVSLGEGTSVGPNCMLTNVQVGANCEIFANSVLENSVIANDCQIGPFARIRPGSYLASKCKVGNFVEIKNAQFDENSKASHLSYIGDASIGKDVNIGAGTITCNYDGVNKHRTIIEDGVFVGSDTQLVAPVVLGANATIGAGSTIRRDVPPNELTLTESRQKTVSGWKRPRKQIESPDSI